MAEWDLLFDLLRLYECRRLTSTIETLGDWSSFLIKDLLDKIGLELPNGENDRFSQSGSNILKFSFMSFSSSSGESDIGRPFW